MKIQKEGEGLEDHLPLITVLVPVSIRVGLTKAIATSRGSTEYYLLTFCHEGFKLHNIRECSNPIFVRLFTREGGGKNYPLSKIFPNDGMNSNFCMMIEHKYFPKIQIVYY